MTEKKFRQILSIDHLNLCSGKYLLPHFLGDDEGFGHCSDYTNSPVVHVADDSSINTGES